mgnify:CR=1 FL=1|tara:strand:- start:42 stop:554 length:513 start_codon:yes stop_codon:yes gene_type:complete
MARRKSRISRSLSRSARLEAREALQSFREEDNPETVRSTRPEVSNYDLLNEIQKEKQDAKQAAKQSKRAARRNAEALRQEEGPRAKIEYSGFSPGDLVTISKRAFKRYNLEYNNLFEGATGVIVEQDDMQLWRGDYEKGRWVQVMGPNGLQQWDVRWCTHLDDMDEEDED